MTLPWTEVNVQLAMAIFNFSAERRKADSLGHFLPLFASVDRPMNVNQTSAAREKWVDRGCSLVAPTPVLIKNDHVCFFHLIRRREFPSRINFRFRRLSQESRPDFLPRRIIVLAFAVVLGTCYKNDAQRWIGLVRIYFLVALGH